MLLNRKLKIKKMRKTTNELKLERAVQTPAVTSKGTALKLHLTATNHSNICELGTTYNSEW